MDFSFSEETENIRAEIRQFIKDYPPDEFPVQAADEEFVVEPSPAESIAEQPESKVQPAEETDTAAAPELGIEQDVDESAFETTTDANMPWMTVFKYLAVWAVLCLLVATLLARRLGW